MLERDYILQTDSPPLKFSLSYDTSLPNIVLRRIDRWACQLKKSQLKTEYTNTKLFGKVGGLSRLPTKEFQNLEKNDTKGASVVIIENAPIDTVKVMEETSKDKECKLVMEYKKKGWPKKLPGKLKEHQKIKDSSTEKNSKNKQ